MEKAEVSALFLPLDQHSGEVQFYLDNAIADAEKDGEDVTKQALHRMTVVDIVVHEPSCCRRMVILSAV